MIRASRSQRGGQRAALITEMVIALSLLALALIPLAYSVLQEGKLAARYYERAVLMQVIDGEMEWLAASRAASVAEGIHPYRISAPAATNLPPGRFQLHRKGFTVRLEWQADGRRLSYFREMELRP